MLHADFYICRIEKLQAFMPRMHQPARYELYVVLFAGPDGARHFLDRKEIFLPPYSVLFVGPGKETHFSTEYRPDTYVVSFSSAFYGRSSRDLNFLHTTLLFNDFEKAYMMVLPEDGVMYSKVFVSMLYRARKGFGEPMHNDLAHNLIEQILIMGSLHENLFTNLDFKYDRDSLLILKYRTLVNQHFAREKKVVFYANKLNVTERRLNTASERVLQLGAKDVITRRIMQESKRLLTYSELSIKEISLMLGFSEEQNLSTFFLTYSGIRPKEYRKNRK